ncbi:MAG TPA: DMP19 family protein [Gemmatimonadales bacterium]
MVTPYSSAFRRLALIVAVAACGDGGGAARNRLQMPAPRPVAEILQLQDDTDFAIAMSELVFAREAAVGFGRLTAPERVVFCLDALEREVNNGGFAQFFENSSGDYALETIEALRALGATRVAALVAQAVAVFPGGRPEPDRERRQAQVGRLDNTARAKLDQLDGAFYDSPENLAALERQYVSRHQSEFLMP